MSPVNHVPVLGSGIPFAAAGAVLVVAAGLFSLRGCGDDKLQQVGQSAGAEAGASAESVVAVETPPPAGTVQIAGFTKFEGERPPSPPIKMSADATCEKAHGGATVRSEDVVIGEAGELANVFIYVKSGLGDKKFPVPSTPVELDQKGCVYVPHVLGMMAGQQINIVSSDTTLHNVNCLGGENPPFNFGMPGPGTRDRVFRKPEIGVKFKCDVHPWMGAWVHVVEHPFFAVTDATGAWSINGLPTGEYTLAAWHEKFGEQEQKISVTDAGLTNADFTFKAAEKK